MKKKDDFNPDEFLASDFDPDQFLSEKDDFDPDAFLAQEEAPRGMTFIEGVGRSALENLPALGSTVGGTIGAVGAGGPTAGSGAIPGAMAGAALGGATGAALRNLIKGQVLSEPVSTREIISDPINEALLGAAGEGVGGAASSALKAAPGAILRPNLKKNAEEISRASKELGFKATPGMLSESRTIGMTESSLEQSPSVAASIYRAFTTAPARRRVQFAAGSLFSDVPENIPSDVGRSVRDGIKEALEERLAKTSAYFEKIRERTPFIQVPEESKNKLMDSFIASHTEFPNSAAAKAATAIAKDIGEITSVDSLKRYKTIVGEQYASTQDDTLKRVFGDLYRRLKRLERHSILRDAISNTRMKGYGAKLVKEILSANKNYRKIFDDIGEISLRSKIKKPMSVKGFLDNLDKIPDEELADRLFNINDKRSLEALKNVFPEQYEQMRNAKLNAIMRRSLTPKGEILPSKLITNIDNIDDKTVKFIFGDEKKKVLDLLKVVVRSSPQVAGPSGTPAGVEFLSMLSPMALLREVPRASQSVLNLTRVKVGAMKPNIPATILSPVSQNVVRDLMPAPIPAPMLTEEDVRRMDLPPSERAKRIDAIRRRGPQPPPPGF